ncbi:ATPase [Zhengella mangrovi]|uniref:ATPase n=1 Tax=Zhengella mangrovi TaxID=1982044 RepID=A0A2G1QN87_9HYPH|nr:FoF1 ATP synthase subunit gamma [Zhengella mangrovi]PHP66983.1 ATPase [Zhengella mangrovi]
MELAAISQRIENTRQIESVIVAMRAIAASHLQEARRHVAAIRDHEASVALAMAEALALPEANGLAPPPEQAAGAALLIVVGAGQGFCGLFNDTIVNAALAGLDAGGELIVIGQRCASEFQARKVAMGLTFAQSPRASDVPRLASRIADAFYERIEAGGIARAVILHADPDADQPVRRPLFPFDFTRIGKPVGHTRPLTQLPRALLLEDLVREYVFAEICEALMLGFAAENNARMQAMLRARANVSDVIAGLRRDYNQARQQHTTSEILELSESV